MATKYTRDEFIDLLCGKTNDIELIGDYNGIFFDTDFKCANNHIFSSRPHNILNRLSCPICSGKLVAKGINDLWTVRPDVATLLKNKESGYTNGVGSNKKEPFVCPKCGKISNKAISKVVLRGFSCDYCSDGISFPNKMLRYILSNLRVDNVDFEWSPHWLKPRRYDGYFELHDSSYVVEMDGGIGHTNSVDGLQIDMYKDDLAKQHNVKVIRIDCDYDNVETRFEYIKANLLKSQLAEIVDLSLISWDECLKSALSSNVIMAAELYNKRYNIAEIANLLKCNRCSVRDWLKQASKIDLCDYSVNTIHRYAHKKLPSNTIPIQQLDNNGGIINTFSSVAEAHRVTGINNISAVLNGNQKSAGGFLWKRCTADNTK